MLCFSKIAVKCIRQTVDPLLTCNIKPMEQQFRTTFVLERYYSYPLAKKGREPRQTRSKYFIYKMVACKNAEKHPWLKVILMKDHDGVGESGDVVELPQRKAYNTLILPKVAVYASPENLEKYAHMKKTTRTYSSLLAPVVMKQLQSTRVCVSMNAENPWVMEKFHVLVALRKMGFHVPIEAIELPEKSIVGPDLDQEGNEFYVTVVINKKERANVRCVLRHLCTDPNKKLPFPENYWEYLGEPMYPEFEEVLSKLPQPTNGRLEERPLLDEEL